MAEPHREYATNTAGHTTRTRRRRYLEGHRRNPLTTTAWGGRLLSRSQLLWFQMWPPRGFGVLTTRGRRSGKSRRLCVRAIRHGTRIHLVSLRGPHAAWMHNIRADPHVRIRIRGGTFRGVARPIADATDHDDAKAAYCQTVNPFDRLEYMMHRPGRPTPSRIRQLHEHWFAVGSPLTIDLAGDWG